MLILISSLLFFSFPSSIYAQSAPAPKKQDGGYIITSPSGESFKIIPIPPGSSANPQPVPIPPGNQGGYTEKYTGLTDFGDFFGGILDKFKSFGACLADLGGCFKETTGNIIEFGALLLQKLAVKQIGGEKTSKASDCLTRTSKIEALNDPECAQLTTYRGFIEYFSSGNPGEFGLLGIADYTSQVAMRMPVPVSSGQYLASINPFKEAHAQSGFDELKGNRIVLEVWQKVRNASLALIVVALVVIGFMIMFRVPINPRTVVTVQNALPRIIIALILIVFSFALSGLMIDIARIASNMIHSFLPSANLPGGLVGILPLFASFLFSMLLIGGFAFAAIVMLAVILIVLITFLVITVMIIWKLVTRLVVFLILTMFAPLLLVGAALPGSEQLILGWFKKAAAALLSIVGISFVVNLALTVGLAGLGSFDLDFAGGGGAFPALGANKFLDIFSWAFAAPVIGMVLYSFALKVPEIIDDLLNVRPLGAKVAGGFAVGVGVANLPRSYISWRGQGLKMEKEVATEGTSLETKIVKFLRFGRDVKQSTK